MQAVANMNVLLPEPTSRSEGGAPVRTGQSAAAVESDGAVQIRSATPCHSARSARSLVPRSCTADNGGAVLRLSSGF